MPQKPLVQSSHERKNIIIDGGKFSRNRRNPSSVNLNDCSIYEYVSEPRWLCNRKVRMNEREAWKYYESRVVFQALHLYSYIMNLFLNQRWSVCKRWIGVRSTVGRLKTPIGIGICLKMYFQWKKYVHVVAT